MDNQFLNFGNPPISMGGYFFIAYLKIEETSLSIYQLLIP